MPRKPGALRPAFVVVDELAQWAGTAQPRQLWEAVSTALAKLSGARLVVLTTAGDPAHWSHAVLEHALSDPLWRVHEVPGPVPWLEPARLGEQRRRLPESSFRRLFLNEWVSAEDRLVSAEDLVACATLTGPLAPEPGRRYTLGLDLGLTRDRTVACLCHAEPILGPEERMVGTRVVLDRLQVWQGSRVQPVSLAEVEEWPSWVAKLQPLPDRPRSLAGGRPCPAPARARPSR